jgi:hypothetical protein
MILRTVGIAVSLYLLVSAFGAEHSALAEMHRPSVEASRAEAAHANVAVFDEAWSRVRDSFMTQS